MQIPGRHHRQDSAVMWDSHPINVTPNRFFIGTLYHEDIGSCVDLRYQLCDYDLICSNSGVQSSNL
ncbi:hypothetical protein HZS_3988 [Henneguya salminicola]|nr:hypothetical protein HZS_3988 [Henneguya salminicola]